MSWQFATLALLVFAVLGGFAWYERSRPPSQVIALVAALAAVAVAGRVALAAVPNLVATTDIVFFAGFALGPAPGFAVGAIAGLVSNFWLGQGPWTPWQMAGWGGVGIMGAALAVLVRRPPGRIVLGTACGLAAILFGLLMNFSTMATFGGEMSFERFAALQSRAVPFDVMHMVGNVVLAVVAGPAILRMLDRFKRRFEWRRGEAGEPGAAVHGVDREGSAAAAAVSTGRLAALAVAILIAASVVIAPDRARAADYDIDAAVGWLGSVQNSDGGFGPSPGDESSTVTTAWTILGLAAAGVNAHDMRARGSNTPVDFLRRNVESITSTGDFARTVMALSSAGADPRRFAGRNLVTELRGRMRQSGSFEGWPGATSFAMIALRQAGSTGGLRRSAAWLHSTQNDDGGWGPTVGAPSDPDTTGAVLQAVGGEDLVRRAVAYLRQVQRPSGGFPLGGASSVNTQSTAWAIQGLLAVGLNPSRFATARRSATEYLAAHQVADGHFRYSARSDQTPTWVTANALVAAAGKTFPVPPPPREPRPDPRPAPSAPFPDHIPPPPPIGGVGAGGSVPAYPAPMPSPGGSFGGSGGGGPELQPQPIDPGAVRGGTPGRPGAGSPPPQEPGTAAPGAVETIDLDLDRDVGPVEETRPGPSPAAPAGIGMGLAGLTAGGMWWFGRRRAW